MSNVIIITETKNKKGNYEFTEEKLRELIQEAYDKGYQQGVLSVPISINPTPYHEFNPGPGIKPPSDGAPTPWWGEVTCRTLNCEHKSADVDICTDSRDFKDYPIGEQIPIPGLEDL